ncbi:MAG TPA: universal stress protein [Phenylobacterium sp.]|uniref:universal stress protein n=1 Tax=Phenylobacterium sp. TaxID=1871053 RepID=UPI002F94703A
MYPDLLLATLTYPDATPDRAIRNGVALASGLGGALRLLALEVDIPEVKSSIGQALFRFERLAVQEERRSALIARRAVQCAEIAAEEAGVVLQSITITAAPHLEGDVIAGLARTHDLCLMPIGPSVLADRGLAEAVLFGSGRPVLVYPNAPELTSGAGFGTVVLAWDGSSRAARAIAEAMPIVKQASNVRIYVALGEKPSARAGIAGDLVRHLQAHGVRAAVDEHSVDRPIGEALCAYVRSVQADMLVMGGFARPRLQELVLGGATNAILESPPCPVFLSH